MAPACPSSVGARAWASNHQGVKAPRTQVFKQKDTRKESIFRRHQETARNTGRARWKHRGKGGKDHDITTRDQQGSGPPVDL